MPNPYPVEIKDASGVVRVEGFADFTDAGNQPDSSSIPQGGPLTATLDADGQAIENVGGITATNTVYLDPEGADEPALKIGPSTEPPDDGNHAQLFLDAGLLKVKLPDNAVHDIGPLPWRGTWDALTTYDPGDLVENAGSVYIAIDTSLNSEPPSVKWDAVVVAGDTGLPVTWTDGGHGNVIARSDGEPCPLIVHATNTQDDPTFLVQDGAGTSRFVVASTGATSVKASDGSGIVIFTDAGAVGFFGDGPAAQQTLDPSTATPEDIVLALRAFGLNS